MDAFFAAIEQRDNPLYRGKPVVVGANPKDGRGRGVVSTCSYEARVFGIHSAMPISIAYRKCPDAIFLPVDMEKYSRVSEQIFKILEYFTPLIELVSIDEAFLDISGTYKLHGTPHDTCVVLKNRIKKETGLTASIGIAPTKMAAKIASGLKKPDGLVEIKRENLMDFLRPLDVGKIWGIGPKTKAVFNQMGITTIGELAKISREELLSRFGKNGNWFWEMAQGIDESDVETERETKSVSNEITFERDTLDKKLIEKALAALCEEVSTRLRGDNLKSRTITFKIRFEDFKTHTSSATIVMPTNFFSIIYKESKRLYNNFEIGDKKVRLIGVKVSNLSSAGEEQFLFKDSADTKRENVQRAVDKIREKFGNNSIYNAVRN